MFELIASRVTSGAWTLYLEELQWLASYDSKLIAELKYVWDNHFRNNPKLILILCGSAPSFMINQVLHSQALYNRSQHELRLRPFSLNETKAYLGRSYSRMQVLDAQLTVGGIPEYLHYLRSDASTFLALCKESFTQDGFFTHEYDRVFTSSMAKNRNYRKTIQFLSKRRYASRGEILKHLQLRSGGGISELLIDLQLCDFITQEIPFHLGPRSTLARYHMSDPYLQFYFKFIQPRLKNIQRGDYNDNPTAAVNRKSFDTWLGFAFERFCRQNDKRIAAALGIQGIHYRAGSFLPGDQIKVIRVSSGIWYLIEMIE